MSLPVTTSTSTDRGLGRRSGKCSEDFSQKMFSLHGLLEINKTKTLPRTRKSSSSATTVPGQPVSHSASCQQEVTSSNTLGFYGKVAAQGTSQETGVEVEKNR